MTDPSLTLRTLRLTRGPNAPVWYHPTRALFRFNQETFALESAPMVGLLRSSDGERVAGRFFPVVEAKDPRSGAKVYISAILAFENNDPEVTRATVLHELNHWLLYETCGLPKSQWSRCRYKGEHNARFVETMESLYRQNGVPLRIAQIVEGDYIESYPAHWRGEQWAG